MKPRRHLGFSLVEVMVVVAILGIVSAVAAPDISDLVKKRGAALAGVRLHKEIEVARDQARAERACLEVQRETTSAVRISRLKVVGGACAPGVVLGVLRVVDFGSANIALPSTVLIFQQDGSLRTAAGVDRVDYTYDDVTVGERRTLRVFATLGLVRRL